VIDEEVQKLLREADQRAYDLLAKHRTEMDRLVEALLQKEELISEEIEELLGHAATGSNNTPTQTAIMAPS